MQHPVSHSRHSKQSVALFKGLTEEQISAIVAAGHPRRYTPTTPIIRSDEPALHLYLLQTGHVNFSRVAEDGRQILLGRLVPADVFGLGSLVADTVRYIGTADTVTESEVLIWERNCIRRLATACPLLAENALRIALHYVGVFVKRHIALVSDTAEERLAYTLIQIGSRAGHMLPAGLEVDIKNEDLASLADISVFTASRFLKSWEREGALEKHRGKVLIRCPEKLLVA
jgi:CRP-like cAMP-binding protein